MPTKWQPLPIKEGGTDGTTPKSARRALGISEGASSDNMVSVKDFPFGAVGDGVTDDTAAIQAAHDSLGADGGAIYFPPTASYYKLVSQVAFTKDVVLFGAGIHSSEIASSVNALVWFTHTAKFIAVDMGFTAIGAAIGTCTFVKGLSSASNHGDSGFYRCSFDGASKGYWSQRTNKIQIHHNTISCASGLVLENLTSSDEGDSFISNNTISCTTIGVSVLSTSGLYLYNNKFNGACPVHIDFAPTTNAVGDYTISGGSIEGQTTAGVRLIATSGIITKTIINGVQFSSAGATHIIVGQAANNTVISGCIFSDTNAANGIGIDLQASSVSTTITGNAFHQILTAIKSSSGITGQLIYGNRCQLSTLGGSNNVTDFYLGGEDETNLNGSGSEKELEWDRIISNTSNAVYVNAFQWKGSCIADIEVAGVVQGAGNSHKYRKVLCDGTTVTDLIAVVTSGQVFDLQVISSGGFFVAGIKRNGATGSSVTMQVRVKLTGYVRDFSKV